MGRSFPARSIESSVSRTYPRLRLTFEARADSTRPATVIPRGTRVLPSLTTGSSRIASNVPLASGFSAKMGLLQPNRKESARRKTFRVAKRQIGFGLWFRLVFVFVFVFLGNRGDIRPGGGGASVVVKRNLLVRRRGCVVSRYPGRTGTPASRYRESSVGIMRSRSPRKRLIRNILRPHFQSRKWQLEYHTRSHGIKDLAIARKGNRVDSSQHRHRKNDLGCGHRPPAQRKSRRALFRTLSAKSMPHCCGSIISSSAPLSWGQASSFHSRGRRSDSWHPRR